MHIFGLWISAKFHKTYHLLTSYERALLPQRYVATSKKEQNLNRNITVSVSIDDDNNPIYDFFIIYTVWFFHHYFLMFALLFPSLWAKHFLPSIFHSFHNEIYNNNIRKCFYVPHTCICTLPISPASPLDLIWYVICYNSHVMQEWNRFFQQQLIYWHIRIICT